jgi:molybdopterin biosynthesis enzyme
MTGFETGGRPQTLDTPMDPLEGLKLVTSKLNPNPPESVSLDGAPCGYLAETIECPPAGGGVGSAPLAAVNGYALSGGTQPAATCRVSGVVAVEGPLEMKELLAEIPAAKNVLEDGAVPAWRVESGAVIPEGCDRVVSVTDTVLVGKGRIRLQRSPRAGEGILYPPGKKGESTQGAPQLELAEGTYLGDRLRALLISRGVRTARMRPPVTVALASIGNELLDPRVPPDAGQRSEVTMSWLEGAISRLGLDPLSLGTLPDTPEGIRDAIFHVRRRAKVLILVGGLGDGLTDRTVDGIRRFDTHPIFTRLELDGCSSLLFSKTQGIDILGLSGRPLAAAAGYDLFVQPGLLSMLGARASVWDWTAVSRSVEIPSPWVSTEGASWAVRPVAAVPAAKGAPGLRILEVQRSRFYPVLAEQIGWAVFPVPGTNEESGKAPQAYFQEVSSL